MFPKIFFPEITTIETQHLHLRKIESGDLESYFALCADEVVMRTWGTPVHRDRIDTLRLIEFLEDSHRRESMIRWAITEKGNPTLIGDVGFWRFVKERARAEIGAKLRRDFWSRGYMTEALTAVIEFGFSRMGLHSVEANVDPENPAAIRLVEKVGFEREGFIREHSFSAERDRFVDTALFSVVNGRWTANERLATLGGSPYPESIRSRP